MDFSQQKLTDYISFDDFPITNFEFLPEKKELRIEIEGGWCGIDSVTELGPGILLLCNWENLIIKYFNNDLNSWYELEYSEFDSLKEICEFKEENSILYLTGFGKRMGWWTEWCFDNPQVIAKFPEKKQFLINILLDKNEKEDKRVNACKKLCRFEDTKVVEALIQVTLDHFESDLIVKHSAKSLGELFSKENLYDQKLINQLTPRAREIVYGIIKNKKPS